MSKLKEKPKNKNPRFTRSTEEQWAWTVLRLKCQDVDGDGYKQYSA